MLVINSNNNNLEINSMVWWQLYPDFNQILAIWKNTYYVTNGVPSNPSAVTVNISPSDMPHIEVRWKIINNYSPKFYKQYLYSWICETSKLNEMPRYDFAYHYYESAGWGSSGTRWHRLNFWYNIWVSWIPAWKIIWEEMIFQLWIFRYWTSGSIYPLSNQYWWIDADVSLLHTDWTTTSIWTVNMVCPFTNTGNQLNLVMWDIFLWQLTTWWVTSQEWDILFIEIHPNTYLDYIGTWKGQSADYYIWVCFWWTNNIDYWAPLWFRPFQVSIRDN